MHGSLFALLLSMTAVQDPISTSPISGAVDSVLIVAIVTDSVIVAGPRMDVQRVGIGAPRRAAVDTPTVVSIEYSDWYERRLTIHRWASYATLPLFAFQYVAGRRLYDESSDAPGWAKTGHGIAATGVAALFTVNTVTGVWNLWDSRKDPEGRTRRTVHAVLMLAADAGFTATGLLAERAEGPPDDRALHRNVALASVGVATLSYLIMIPPLRRD